MPKGYPIKIDRNEFNKLYDNLKSVEGVAKKLGYGFDSVRSWMKREGVELKKKTKYYHDEDFFSRDTEGSFYWAGFIAADGCIMEKGRDYVFVLKITLASRDEKHLYKFKTHIQSTSPISRYNFKEKPSGCCKIIIYNAKTCSDLSRFNITPRKSLNYTFPDHLKDHKLIRHFIRGYIDGDGCFTWHKKTNRTTGRPNLCIRGTVDFLTSVKSILDKQFVSTKRSNNVKIYDSIGSLSYCSFVKVDSIINYLYNGANIYLDRKFKIIEPFL
jgi:hypothetical protein